eukprot:GHRQ01010696.1.p1 GENE.GHRQ01010696.1~~GHRQ01010696.1.p1  ORF type:complete len:370 (+),score=184.96 GHRQ01010696.1:251-1360(+)
MLVRAINPQLLPLAWAATHVALPAMSTAAVQAGLYNSGKLDMYLVQERARGLMRPLLHPTLQQQSAGFAAKAAFAHDSDEEAITTSTDKISAAKMSAAKLAEDIKQRQQLGEAGSAATAASSSWLPHDVRMAMRTHAYPTAYLEAVSSKHLPPEKLHQQLALRAVLTMRASFDLVTGYRHGKAMPEGHWLRRIIFLETVAGVPGMVGGMLRHLRSLRLMQRDNGWTNTLLEEAENERMHLLTFMEMRQPGVVFRGMVIAAQAVFFSAFAASYMINPKFCHAFVGYLEEEAVKTYTQALQEIDAGRLWPGKPAPPIACYYWGLPEGASMRQLVLAVRADEAHHSHVNHTFARLPQDGPNPFDKKDSDLVP